MGWASQKPFDGADTYKFQRELHTRLKFGSFTWNPPNVPATSTVDTVLTTTDSMDLSGLRAGMSVSVSPPSGIDSGLTWGALVATDDTLTVRLGNATASGINAASGTWSFSGMVI